MHSRPIPQVGMNFEYLMWVFTRISGLVLYLLAIIGITAAFIMGARTKIDIGALARWTFFPNPNHVVNTNIPDVTLGWANAWWQIMQMLLLVFGVTHGMNGIRVVIEDYIGSSWAKVFLRGVVFLFWIFMLIIGIYVILAS
jgi:succinate dehydrogenase / fumarate reductase membrane anchor subunit